jgi:hypothetical protein
VRRLRVALVALGAAAALGGCGDKAASTLLVATIGSDLAVTGQMDEVRLVVQRPGGPSRELRFPLASAGNLPVNAGLLPASGGEDEVLVLTATGYKDGAKKVETVAEAAFKRGQKENIEMFLAAACMNDPCQGANQTCGAGGACIPRRRPTTPWDPGTGKDAAATDAPVGTDGPAVTDAPIGIDAPDAPIGDDAGNCTCPSDDNPCTQDFCMGGTCRHEPVGDRVGCPGALCIEGACCTGCIDNMGRCRVGNNVLFCGSAARDCTVCNDQDACTQDGCMNGTCRTQPLTGPTCPTGVCVDGRCQCGGAGQPCCAGGACNEPGTMCMNGTCGGCGADGQPCCGSGSSGGNICGPGLLCEGGKCGKCGGAGQPCCADGSCQTGNVCAGATRICQPCGGMGQPCCATGDACGMNLACLNGSCGCGGQNQPCCGGTMCTSDNNACNGVEMCTNGVCTRSPAVVCTARSQCHMVGLCDPATGRCSEPVRPNGSICNDGNGCTAGDQCRDGICIAATMTVCNDNNLCTDDSCVAPMGCSFKPAPGKSCAPPGDVCRADTCNTNGTCVAMAANENGTCRLPTGANGRCVGGACCPILGPCAAPF